MTQWYINIKESIRQNRDDLEYLLFVGLPGGIILLLLNEYFDLSKLF